MKIKLLIAVVIMCLFLASCDLGDLGALTGSSQENASGNETLSSADTGTSFGDASQSDEADGDITDGEEKPSSGTGVESMPSIGSDVESEGATTDDSTENSEVVDEEESDSNVDNGSEDLETDKSDDVIDETVDTNVNTEVKDELIDKLEEYKNIITDIENDMSLTEDEKISALYNEYYSIMGMLESVENAYSEQIYEFLESENEAIAEIGNALLNNDKEKLAEIIDYIKYYNDSVTGEHWAKIFESLNDAVSDFRINDKLSDEVREIVEEYYLEVKEVLDRYGSCDEEELKEKIELAIDEYSHELMNFMDAHFEKIQRIEGLIEMLENRLGIFGGSNEENEEEQKPDDEQGPIQRPEDEELKEEEQKPNEGEQEDPTVETIYIPGIGNIPLDLLLENEELLKEEFEKMYGRPLTDAELRMIKAYLSMIK